MPTSHKNKSSDYKILSQLLESNSEIQSGQVAISNSLNDEINRMDADTRNRNSLRDSRFRSKIASILTWAFVVLLGIIIVFIPIYNATLGNSSQIDVYRLLEAFNSAFGAVLGFVLGYYFKNKHDGVK